MFIWWGAITARLTNTTTAIGSFFHTGLRHLDCWEEISIQADSEHVLVFLYGSSVYLAWPTIAAGQKGNLKWKIGMNLAKRTAAGWTKLKKGRGEIEIPMVPNKDERTSLAFRTKYNNPNTPDETVSIES